MFVCYLRTFARLGLQAIPMRADTGPIGGDMSHEFVVLAETGESEIAYHRQFGAMDWAAREIDPEADLQPMVDEFTARYAATDEQRDPAVEAALGEDLVVGRGIEVGHIFYFGTKYSVPMRAMVAGPDGGEVAIEMGSYGIGVSRLVGAVIEASHDAAGIIWPAAIAPFDVGIINLKADDAGCVAACDELYASLCGRGVAVLYDDRSDRAGVKFADMDLIGVPRQLIIGPKGLAAGTVELKDRRSGERAEVSRESALAQLAG